MWKLGPFSEFTGNQCSLTCWKQSLSLIHGKNNRTSPAAISLLSWHTLLQLKEERKPWTGKWHCQAATSFCQHPESDYKAMCTGGAHLISSAHLLPSQPAADTLPGHCGGNELPCKGKQAKAGDLQNAATHRKKIEKLMVFVCQNRQPLSGWQFVKISNRVMHQGMRMSSEPSAKGYGARHKAHTNMQLKCKASISEHFQLLK